jgi:hypothetical protein
LSDPHWWDIPMRELLPLWLWTLIAAAWIVLVVMWVKRSMRP